MYAIKNSNNDNMQKITSNINFMDFNLGSYVHFCRKTITQASQNGNKINKQINKAKNAKNSY